MTPIQFKTNGLTVLAHPVPEHYQSHIIYMGYLQFKVWNEKNGWDSCDAMNPEKIVKYLEKHDPSKDYKTIPVKLPEGNWKSHAITTEMTEEEIDGMRLRINGINFWTEKWVLLILEKE